MTNDDELLAGNELMALVDGFLAANPGLIRSIKMTESRGDGLVVRAMRCRGIEALAELLEKRAVLATLAHQHDMVLVLANVVLLGGNMGNLKVRAADSTEIDIDDLRGTIELKTAHDMDASPVPELVREYHAEMVASKARKKVWWLCFFERRPAPKGKIGDTCMYYLILVEIGSRPLKRSAAARAEIEEEAKALTEDVEKKVVKEDDVEEGFLVPVKNIWIVDKLRGDLERAEAEKQRAEAEKQQLAKELAEQKAKNKAMQDEIAKLKKRLDRG
nr:hypothetical protein [Candidatus Sigynarchaeum springense]